MKLGAFTYKAPAGMVNAGVRAAVWLAFESLPLFPCFYESGLEVRGFLHSRREYAFYWPVWRPPIDLEVLGSLLGLVPAAIAENPAALDARGVTAVYRSERFKPNKYLFSFRTPELVLGGTAAAAVA
jgi:hypothetical protein